jgi:hypothetical protein
VGVENKTAVESIKVILLAFNPFGLNAIKRFPNLAGINKTQFRYQINYYLGFMVSFFTH